MSRAAFPAIEALVPQTGPLCLLDRVVEHGPDHTVCAVDPGRSGLLAAPDGSLPAWLGLEYMAQCIAAHGGLVALARGEPPRPGVLIGARRVRFGVQRFEAGRELRVGARHHRGERGLLAFDCEVRDARSGAPLVQGRLNVYTVDELDALEAVGDDGG
jgi:predicted hotdog family 3-hydroxylacyl-ACP dehydratase